MTDSAIYPIPTSFNDAHITPDRYQALYKQSLEDPDAFWSEQATMLDWHQPWTQVSETNIATGEAHWFVGAQLNVSVNCIDRHLPHRENDIAIIWREMIPMTASHSPIRNSRIMSAVSPMRSSKGASARAIVYASTCR